MVVRSIEQLDLQRSWARILTWARKAVMDVPDRMPFEVAERLWQGSPVLTRDHAVQPVQLVLATKTAGPTARPFARVHPQDLLLYQALVDSMRIDIESALGPSDEVFAYRLSPLEDDDPLKGSPSYGDYARTVLRYADESPDSYIVQADVASFFISISVNELERRLLEVGASATVVRDLRALLDNWQAEGIRGLPQGLLPSSVLGNFYLTAADQTLRSAGVPFWRYMDDMAFAASGFHAGRELLDRLEGAMYGDGLSLGSSKTKVIRASSAGDEFQTIRERFNERFRELIRSLGDYAPEDDDISEFRIDQIRGLFDDAAEALRSDEYRRSELLVALQELGRAEDGHALPELPYLLLRLPGLTKVACNYMADVNQPEHREDLVAALEAIVLEERFHRPQEWLHILRAVTVAGDQVAPSVVLKLQELVSSHEHPLVRCRALLAWGRQSAADDFAAADEFFVREGHEVLGYAVIAIQGKAAKQRNARFEKWSSEGRALATLANSLRGSPLPWHAT